MFSIKFNELEPFVTPAGNEIMGNISATNAFGDCSLTATLRALLFNRLNGEKFNAIVNDFWIYNANDPLSKALENVLGKDTSNLLVFLIAGNKTRYDEFNKMMDPKKLKEEKIYNLQHLKDLSEKASAKSKINCQIFNNPERNLAFIIAENLDIRTLRLFSSLMTRYCPKLFENKPLTPDELEFLGTLTRRNADDYKAALVKLSKNMNLREKILKVIVKDFERRETQRMIHNEEATVATLAASVEDMMRRYADAVKKHKKEMMMLEGMKQSLANQKESSELLDYLSANKSVDLLKIDGSTMHITIRTFCDVFDQNTWNKYSERGDLFRHYNPTKECFKKPENIKKLMDAIFCENPLIRLKFCGYYNLNLDGHVYSQSGRRYDAEYKDYMPNPHLQIHNCLGDNRAQISQMLTRGNTIGAIECATASCKALNLSEVTQTVRPMINDIIRSDNKIIHTEDGDMTPEEALKWLEEKEKK